MYLTLVRPHMEYASQVWNISILGEVDSILLILDAVRKFKNLL